MMMMMTNSNSIDNEEKLNSFIEDCRNDKKLTMRNIYGDKSGNYTDFYLIHYDTNPVSLDLKKVMDAYPKSKYIGEVSHPAYSNTPVSLFYQPKPAKKEYSNYFGIVLLPKGLDLVANIIDGLPCVKDQVFQALLIPETNVCTYSGFRHDFQCFDYGTSSYHIDGGQEYIKMSANASTLPLVIHEGRWTLKTS